VTYDPPFTNSVPTNVEVKLSETVSIKDFGAVGDGVTDDLAAVKLALESGFVVDGSNLTYAIDGTCTPTSFVGLQNANFVQIGDNTTTNINTLNIVGFDNFFIDNVTINMGTNVTTLFADDGNNGLYVAGSASGSESRNFRITRVTVFGNGCGTGIHVRHAERFTVDNCLVRDRISGASPDPTNDSQNGIQINDCANFVLSNTNVYNLRSRLSGIDTPKWTRGILLVEIRDSTILGCNVTIADQGFDFSGGYTASPLYIGNRRWTIGNCTANACLTFGFKFANVTRDGLVTGCIANNTGTIGFVFSPNAGALPIGLEKYNTQNIDVVGCKVVNVLANGWSSANAEGFRVMANGTYPSYPRGIRIKSCSVIDTQDIPTTLTAYGSDVILPAYPATGYDESISNSTTNCTWSGNIPTGFGAYIGINICQLTASAVQSIASGSYVDVTWDLEISDPFQLHSTSSTPANVYIKTPGIYELSCQLSFDVNAAGSRNIRFTKNNVFIDRTFVTATPPSGIPSALATSFTQYLESGDYVAVQVLQDSGGALNLRKNEGFFTVRQVG
jgi:hypothetical protein